MNTFQWNDAGRTLFNTILKLFLIKYRIAAFKHFIVLHHDREQVLSGITNSTDKISTKPHPSPIILLKYVWCPQPNYVTRPILADAIIQILLCPCIYSGPIEFYDVCSRPVFSKTYPFCRTRLPAKIMLIVRLHFPQTPNRSPKSD